MKWSIPKNKYLLTVKNQIFMAILIITIAALWFTAILNTINQRPFVNVAFPILGSIVVFLLYRQYKLNHRRKLIKTIYLTFLCFLYLPASWLTSPGSYSAMAFYAIIILFVSFILANENWEYIFPLGTVLILLLLINYEPLKPEQYTLYTTPQLRALDLSLNFIVASIVLFVVIHILNRYFDNEHKRIFNASVTDPLTGIYNRRYLYQTLEQFMVPNMPNQIQFTLLMMDLNHFKRVNDNHGHGEGDLVLKAFAEVLNAASRKHDIAIRYGGDEFVLLLMEASIEEAMHVEHRIKELFQPICDDYRSTGLSVSFGYASSGQGSIDDLIKVADDQLYQNKGTKPSS